MAIVSQFNSNSQKRIGKAVRWVERRIGKSGLPKWKRPNVLNNESVFPFYGAIINFWLGAGTTGETLTAAIPAGWQLCDGANGTPDLRDKFVMGSAAINQGDDGGTASHTHDTHVLDLSHQHSLTMTAGTVTNDPGGTIGLPLDTTDDAAGWTYTETHSTENHLPPYFKMIYIMYIGE